MTQPDLLAFLAAAAERRASHDPAHDWLHVVRVTSNARRIAEAEGADIEIVIPAALLHELWSYPKGHPDSPRSGEVCAEHAATVLREGGCDEARIARVCVCIREHPFSLGVVPATLEGKVLQDADRLDAIGAIGIARCMATCGVMDRPLYSPADPLCTERTPDDKSWGIDHFYRKLLRIPELLHTATARHMAARRLTTMQRFLAELAVDIGEGA
jgi:uncharacterized protein